MQITQTTKGLRVHAIAGTYVVLLGFDLPEAGCDGLLGFSIHRQDLTENEAYFLTGSKTFTATDPGFPAGSQYPTNHHPIQSFQWADYSAKPGHHYIYTISARKGTPQDLTEFATTVVDIHTETFTTGMDQMARYAAYRSFGIDAAGNQCSRFGDNPPDAIPNRKAYDWLSRGLNEALEAFIRS